MINAEDGELCDIRKEGSEITGYCKPKSIYEYPEIQYPGYSCIAREQYWKKCAFGKQK